jgi:ubiquitin-large subunit ribosomal protein L40e
LTRLDDIYQESGVSEYCNVSTQSTSTQTEAALEFGNLRDRVNEIDEDNQTVKEMCQGEAELLAVACASSLGLDSKALGEEGLVSSSGIAVEHSKVVTISVKPLSDEACELEVEASDTIGKVKSKISCRKGLPAERQRLIFAGKQIHDSRTVVGCKIRSGNAIFLVMQQAGGLVVTLGKVQLVLRRVVRTCVISCGCLRCFGPVLAKRLCCTWHLTTQL